MRKAAKVQYRKKQPAPTMRVLWHPNQVRYVSACGTLPLGFGSVVAVPSVLVYRLEGHTTGLNGPCSRNPQCAGGGPERFSRHGQLHARCTQTR